MSLEALWMLAFAFDLSSIALEPSMVMPSTGTEVLKRRGLMLYRKIEDFNSVKLAFILPTIAPGATLLYARGYPSAV